MIPIYCPTCGKKLQNKTIGDEGLIPYCLTCQKPWFPQSSYAVIVALINEYDEILLLNQKQTSKEYWVLIAGFQKEKERFEDTAIREVYEETGQHIESLSYVTSYVHEHKDLILAGFIAYTKMTDIIKSVEVDGYKWIHISKAKQLLKPDSIAQKLCIIGEERWKNKF